MICNLFDSWNGKFSHAFREHWEALGHTVNFNPVWDGVEKADLNFFYQSDNALIKATTEVPNIGKIVAQCVDIEVWAGQPFAVDWSKVDGCIFLAEHIRSYVVGHEKFPSQMRRALIKPGIDLTKYTFKKEFNVLDKKTPVRKIAYVVGDNRIWDVKRLDIAFQMLRDLMTAAPSFIWQLHVRGTYSSHEQYNRYCKYLEKDLGIGGNVVWYPDRVEDMNEWLEDKDYFLLPSTKEAFSYATAEAMAKGIKPILNNWESSKETWGRFASNTYGEMFTEIKHGKYEPKEYRKFVEDNYDQVRYLKQIDKFLGIEGR